MLYDPNTIETRLMRPRTPKGGVAPLRGDLALHGYLQRQAERVTVRRRTGFASAVLKAALPILRRMTDRDLAAKALQRPAAR